jgi:hypothetical protein
LTLSACSFGVRGPAPDLIADMIGNLHPEILAAEVHDNRSNMPWFGSMPEADIVNNVRHLLATPVHHCMFRGAGAGTSCFFRLEFAVCEGCFTDRRVVVSPDDHGYVGRWWVANFFEYAGPHGAAWKMGDGRAVTDTKTLADLQECQKSLLDSFLDSFEKDEGALYGCQRRDPTSP